MKKLFRLLFLVIMTCMIIGSSISCGGVVPCLDLDVVEEMWEEYVEEEDVHDLLGINSDFTVYVNRYNGEDSLYPFIVDEVAIEYLGFDLDADEFLVMDTAAVIYECDSVKTAKMYYEYHTNYILGVEEEISYIKRLLKKYSDEMNSDEEESLEEQLENLEDRKENNIIGRKGKYIWAGHKEMLEYTKD